MNTDALNNIRPHKAITSAYLQIDAVQHEQAHVQVAGAAVLFLTICQEAGLDVSEVLNKASRITKDDDNPYQPEVRALRAYVRGEIR